MITTYKSDMVQPTLKSVPVPGPKILYAEPQEYFVEIKTINGEEHFFNLAFPGIVFTAVDYRGTYGEFYMYLVHENPFNADGNFKAGLMFYLPLLPHIENYGSICMHPYSRYKTVSIEEAFVYFWNSKATYWTSDLGPDYLRAHYPGDLREVVYHHPEIKDVEYFKNWEAQYNIETISTAPFCQIESKFPYSLNLKLHSPKVLVNT